MAESLRRLVNIGSFTVLQDRLEKWLDDYHVNSCDQNVARCVDIIELNARVQSQLFKLLSITAGEGGLYGGAGVLKSRLLPWLGTGLYPSGYTADRTLSILAETAAKDREINDLADNYERSLQTIELDLQDTKDVAQDLKLELENTKSELEATKRASASDKMFTEAEVRELKTKLNLAEDEIVSLRPRSAVLNNYERQVRNLRDEVSILKGQKEAILNGELALEPYIPPLPRPTSPLAIDNVTQRVRQSNLVTRFNDMFAQDRLDAMDTLRRYSDDNENSQRIIFTAITEAFTAAKLAFSSYKLKVRANLAGSHYGPETLEEAVQDYVNRNMELYDLPALVSDVMRALNRNVRLYLPVEVTYSIISPFIREACKLAWSCSALAHSLEVATATDAELYDDTKYRRSYDSEYTAPLVNHHVWPCLLQAGRVLVKGEAHTRRGASLSPSRRSRSPTRSRSVSPMRALSPSRLSSRARSRSPSPRRLESALNGRASPGPRSTTSRSSVTPSRAVTASTSLSHYGVIS